MHYSISETVLLLLYPQYARTKEICPDRPSCDVFEGKVAMWIVAHRTS